MPNLHTTYQKGAVDKGIARQFPIILTSGRLVEYEGGGEGRGPTSGSPSCSRDMFVEINPRDAASATSPMAVGSGLPAPRVAVPA